MFLPNRSGPFRQYSEDADGGRQESQRGQRDQRPQSHGEKRQDGQRRDHPNRPQRDDKPKSGMRGMWNRLTGRK
ncbi:MAG: hypothetical protein R3F13_05935 [Prosthecobacter sp.]